MQIQITGNSKNRQPKIFLSKPGEKKSCILNSIKTDTVTLTLNLKDFAKLSFDIDKYVYDDYKNNIINANGYNDIDVLMELYLEGIGWFRINETPQIQNDGYKEIKSITAESIQCELQDFNIAGLKINYGTVDSVEMMLEDNITNYPDGLQLPNEQVRFYNPDNPNLSLLNILLQDVYKWTIGHVDDSLKNLIYRFDIDNSNIYNLLMNEISTAYECIFVFDYNNFTINAYSFNDENVLNTGLFKDTNIIIGFRGIENSLVISQNETIYTVYNVNGGDGLNIYYANFGTNRIENLDYFLTTKYMPQSLIDKYIYWRDYRESRRSEYINLSKKYNTQLDVVSELKNRVPNTGCQTDWTTIDDDELLASYSNYLALKAGYESAYVDENGEFDSVAIQNSTDWPDYYSVITYVIPALENEIGVRGLDEQIGVNGSIDYDYNKWETDWTLYGVDELTLKCDEYNEMIASLSDFEQETKPENSSYTDDYYLEMHKTYLDHVANRDSCKTALTERESEYAEANEILEAINTDRQVIVTDVDKSNEQFGFTESDFYTLWKLYNEIDYVNENILTTSLDTTVTTVDVQNELYLDAVEQLSINSRPQYTYSSTLDNLLAMYDYNLFHEDFNCGNYIRVMTDDTHQVKLRITSITFNPMEMENDLTIQFSSMITSKYGRSDKVDLVGISSNQKANSITGTSSSTTSGVDITQQMINVLLKSPQFQNYSQNLTNNILNLAGGSLIIQGGITVDVLKTKLAEIDELDANSAFIKYLEANLVCAGIIQVDDLYAKLAQIDVAKVGKLFAESLQAFSSTVATQTINQAYIMDAIVGKLSVGDLAAGNIILNDNMQILSENGKLIMNGTALQIIGTDSGGNDYVGIQLGYDMTSNPSLILRNADGAVVLTPNGITQDAIADKLIINNMLGDKSVGKRNMDWTNISSGVDANGNPIWDIANIYMNGEQFGAQYTTFKEDVLNSIAGVSLKVDANTKSITDKVWQSDISDSISNYDNTTTQTIRDRVTKTETSITGITNTVSDVQSTLTTKADGTTVTQISNKVSTIEQDASKIYSVVQGDNGQTEVKLTESALTAISENIDITGKVTFKGLIDDNGTTMVDGGKVYAKNLDIRGLVVTRQDPNDSSSTITTLEITEDGKVFMNAQSLTISTAPVATSTDISNVTSQITTLGDDMESNLNTYTNEINESISNINNSISELSQLQIEINNSGILTGFGQLTQSVNSLENNAASTTDMWRKYIEIRDGTMVFGKNTYDDGSPIPTQERTTLTLSNDKLFFTKNSSEVASMTEQALDITEAHILQSLKIGNYIIQPRESGGIAFFVA